MEMMYAQSMTGQGQHAQTIQKYAAHAIRLQRQQFERSPFVISYGHRPAIREHVAEGGFDVAVSLFSLQTINDLPGALIHMRSALNPGGLAIASFIGAGSLPVLRSAMLAADGDRPAPRMHPAVDVRAGGQLLQRAGWAKPVVDSRSLDVRFSTLASLLADLRAQALTNVLTQAGPPLSKQQLIYLDQALEVGTLERFEILTLSGWRL